MNVIRNIFFGGLLLLTVFLATQLYLRRQESAPPTAHPQRSSQPSAITIEGWTYRDGEVEKTEDGAYETLTGFSIEQLAIEVTFAPQSRFRFEEGTPILQGGSMEVAAERETTFGPFQLPGGSGLHFNETEIVVGAGGVLIDGTFIPANTRFPRKNAPAKVEQPNPITDGGRVFDASTGEPLGAARVFFTLSDHPDGDTSIAGLPPALSETTTDNQGRFSVPEIQDAQARRWLRVEAHAPGFVPAIEVTEEPITLSGEWPFFQLGLRRAWLTEYAFYLPEEIPIPATAVRITRLADSYIPEDGVSPLRRGDVEILPSRTLNGRVLAIRDRDRIELTDPTLVPYPAWLPRPNWAGTDSETGVGTTGQPEPIYSLCLYAETQATHQLVDANGLPLAKRLIELTIPDDQRTFRMHTDEEGFFTFGVGEHAPEEPQLTEEPKTVFLKVLDPTYFEQEFEFFIPGHPSRLHLGDATPRIIFSLVELDEDQNPIPIAAEQVQTSRDWILLERYRDGLVVYAGEIPDGGERVALAVRDFAPTELTIPERLDRTRDLDLGTVVLTRRASVPVLFPGLLTSDLEGAVLEISSDEFFTTRFRYPLEQRPRIQIAGIDPLRFYRYRVTGPWIHEASGEFRLSDDVKQIISDSDADRSQSEPPPVLAIPLFNTEVDRFVTSGVLTAIPPHETDRYRVIERYYRDDDLDPVIMQSYPLAPDGTFGSERYLGDVQRYEVVVTSRSGFSAHALPRGADEEGWVQFGTLSPVLPRIGRVRFRVEGAGFTIPPTHWLEGYQDRNHEIVEVAEKFPTGNIPFVELRSLIPGEYGLHWESISTEDGVLAVPVREDTFELDLLATLPPAPITPVIFNVITEDGLPVTDAAVAVRILPDVEAPRSPSGTGSSQRIDPAPREAKLISPGVFLIDLFRDQAHEITVVPASPALAETQLTIPPETEMTAPLQLPATAALTAVLLDPSERKLDGLATVRSVAVAAGEEWPPGTMVRVGPEIEFLVNRGEFRIEGLPQGTHTLEFSHTNSKSSVQVELTLLAGENEREPIRLRTERVFTGIVREERELGIAGAEVALVTPGYAHSYPGRELDPSQIRRRVISGAGGVFEIDLEGIDQSAVWSLRAMKSGFTSAVLAAVDFDGPPADLALREGNRLTIRAHRSGDGVDPLQDRFRLRYFPDDGQLRSIDLGEIAMRGNTSYPDVRPGFYQLEWGSQDRPSFVTLPSKTVLLAPGTERSLELSLEANFREAQVLWNGRPLPRGWVLITDDPADPMRLRSAPVRNGRAMLPLPHTRSSLCVSILPQMPPEHPIDWAIGSARPEPISAPLLRQDPISIIGVGYDLTFHFNEEALASGPLIVEFPRATWTGFEWRDDGVVDLTVTDSTLVIPALEPGIYAYKVRGRNWSIHQSVEITQRHASVSIDR